MRSETEPLVELTAATAVLVNWNQTDITIRAVEALVGDGFPADRIVVVDNGSQVERWQALREALHASYLVRLDRNVGFARACNLGARQLPAEYFLLVNNDAFVHRPGSVQRLVGALRRDGVGIAVPKVLNEDLTLQPSVVPFLRPLVSVVRASGLSRFVPNRMQPRWGTHWDHSGSRFIDAADGAVIALRGEAWAQLGGISERTSMYAEDVDLFWRVRELGWQAWFEGDAVFIHLGNTTNSTRWNLAQRAEEIGSAERLMLEEHLSRRDWRFVIVTTRLGYLARGLVQRAIRDDRAADVSFASFRGLGGHVNPRPVDSASESPQVDIFRPSPTGEG
jgi:N-acetylglucosaminyl-diphospho-decaprenol L-rhamnosyltransferase